MRIISQGGHADIPYSEYTVVTASNQILAYRNTRNEEIVLGVYSSNEKVMKVMEQIRNANAITLVAKNCDEKALGRSVEENNLFCKGISIVGKSASISRITGENFFRMPKDTEVAE